MRASHSAAVKRVRRGLVVFLGVMVVVPLAYLAYGLQPTIACPEGTIRAETRPPAGREQWCERRDQDGKSIRHGPYRAWYADGGLKIEGQFLEGQKSDRWTFWHGNGLLYGKGAKKEEGEFRHGKEHGLWTRWYDFNVKLEEGEYRDGVKHGRWTFWYQIAQKAREGEYWDDQEVGVWLRWNQKGEVCAPEDLGSPVQRSDERAGVSS